MTHVYSATKPQRLDTDDFGRGMAANLKFLDEQDLTESTRIKPTNLT